ncbi:MAG: ATP phosphoribosyltransferase regulatory subunit [Hyphomicrobiaceae bacterium]|nr:ATP phosphoribosyltransferase regulatory subunit [Hyphomicrobiaceae bacterium]
MSRLAIRQLIETAGYRLSDPPILQPADVFLDLAGEDIRTRLFTTQDADGRELCLRPELTIPVCRQHIDNGDPARRANYGYLGPVFRHRPTDSGEFLQAGVESIGRTDREAADAEILSLALSIARAGGLIHPKVTIGDTAVLERFCDGLGLTAHQARRLRRSVGERARMEEAVTALAETCGASDAGEAGLLAAIRGGGPDAARALVEDLIQLAGIKAVGGRTAGEIAERFLDKAESMAAPALSREALQVLGDLVALEVPFNEAPEAVVALASEAGIAIDDVVAAMEARLAACAERGMDLASMTFSGAYGGRLDYYTGFAFEFRNREDVLAGPAVSGGRFDRLMELLGAGRSVPAIGAAVWIDRLPRGNEP